jgi:hypothetical protein
LASSRALQAKFKLGGVQPFDRLVKVGPQRRQLGRMAGLCL